MSRSVAAVIAITLGFPILAMIALAANGGFNPDLLMTFLVGGAVTVFVVGAIFEIKRLADLDHRETASGSELRPPAETPRQASTAESPKPHGEATHDSRSRTVRSEPVQPANLAKPRVYEAPALARVAPDGSTKNDEVLVAAQPIAESTTANEVASQPIMVTPQQESGRSKPAAKAKPATRKRKDSVSPSESPPPKKPNAVKGSRKGEQRKPGNP
jgi:hypothetical protein